MPAALAVARNDSEVPPSAEMAGSEVAALVARARQGDVVAFEGLIGRYQRKVYTFALAFAGNPDAASDLAQEALVKVFRSLGSYRFESSFTTWLYSIVKNVFLDERRSRRGQERTREEPLGRISLDKELGASGTAEETFLANEERTQLMEALREVPETFRVVVMMADVQGLGYDEVADALGVPVGTVKSRLNRGRDALREVLFRTRGKEE